MQNNALRVFYALRYVNNQENEFTAFRFLFV